MYGCPCGSSPQKLDLSKHRGLFTGIVMTGTDFIGQLNGASKCSTHCTRQDVAEDCRSANRHLPKSFRSHSVLSDRSSDKVKRFAGISHGGRMFHPPSSVRVTNLAPSLPLVSNRVSLYSLPTGIVWCALGWHRDSAEIQVFIKRLVRPQLTTASECWEFSMSDQCSLILSGGNSPGVSANVF